MQRELLIFVNPKKIALFFGTICAFLVLLSIIGQLIVFATSHDYVYGFMPKFNLNKENNIPTYFSMFLLLFSAFLLAIITLYKRSTNGAYVRHWAFLSFIFLYCSIDEATMIHELFARPMSKIMGLSMVNTSAWTIPFFTV